MQTVKETLELLTALETVAISAKRIAKNGFEMSDIGEVVELAKQHAILIEGFKGLSAVPAEMKDLSTDEIAQLGEALYNTFLKFQAA